MKRSLVDLFAGAGGFTEGFKQAGFTPIFANDSNTDAVFTYSYNHPEAEISDADIRVVDPVGLRRKLKVKKGELDVLVGGPPCQGFSMAGRRNVYDTRNRLYRHYLRFVEAFEPRIIVMENVPGLLTMRNPRDGKVIDDITRHFDRAGYKVTWKLLNAADFGAPQTRKRVLLIANKLGLENGVLFPKETRGPNSRGKKRHATVRHAIMDIADVEDPDDAWNHKPMKHEARVEERFRLIPPAGDLAENQEYLPSDLRRVAFAYNCKRLPLDLPSVTLVPGHYAFPVHPMLPRTITVREAARLQGFSDKTMFLGSRVNQAQMVGNAVPVDLASSIGSRCAAFLNGVT